MAVKIFDTKQRSNGSIILQDTFPCQHITYDNEHKEGSIPSLMLHFWGVEQICDFPPTSRGVAFQNYSYPIYVDLGSTCSE